MNAKRESILQRKAKGNVYHVLEINERKNSFQSFFKKSLFAMKKYPLSTYVGTPSGSIFPFTTFFSITSVMKKSRERKKREYITEKSKGNLYHVLEIKERKNSFESFFKKSLFAMKKYPLSTYVGTPSGSIFPFTTFFSITSVMKKS